jgi:hypothetical protein
VEVEEIEREEWREDRSSTVAYAEEGLRLVTVGVAEKGE